MVGAARPWSHEDIDLLNSMIADGWPRRAVAERLGRSIYSVQAMATKIGLRIQRPVTRSFQNQIDREVYGELVELARRRGVTAPTMARLIVELSIRTPAFISKLLDDDMPERNAGDDPLPFLDDDDDDAGEPLRSLGAAVPRISAMTLHQIQLCGTAAGPPQLVARAGPTFEIVLG